MLLLDVPYSEKDEAKALGAKWNPELKKWYIFEPKKYFKFKKWIGSVYGENADDNLIICNHLYVATFEIRCFKCGNKTTVIGFGIDDYVYITYGEYTYKPFYDYSERDIHFAGNIEGVPKYINDIFLEKYHNIFNKKTKSIDNFQNYCQHCGVLLNDWYIFKKVSAPFYITSIEQLENINITKINLDFDFIAYADI